MVTVKLFANLRLAVGEKEVDLGNPRSVSDGLDELVDKYPDLSEQLFDEEGELKSYLNVFINGHNVGNKQGLQTPVEDGDTISIFPPLGGG